MAKFVILIIALQILQMQLKNKETKKRVEKKTLV